MNEMSLLIEAATPRENSDNIRYARYKDGAGEPYHSLPVVDISKAAEDHGVSEELKSFLQVSEYRKLQQDFRAETMVTVYQSEDKDGTSYYTCLLYTSPSPRD